MLYYKSDLLQELADAGWNTGRIREEKLLSENTLQYIRQGKMVGMKSLNVICSVLKCQPGVLIGYVDREEK